MGADGQPTCAHGCRIVHVQMNVALAAAVAAKVPSDGSRSAAAVCGAVTVAGIPCSSAVPGLLCSWWPMAAGAPLAGCAGAACVACSRQASSHGYSGWCCWKAAEPHRQPAHGAACSQSPAAGPQQPPLWPAGVCGSHRQPLPMLRRPLSLLWLLPPAGALPWAMGTSSMPVGAACRADPSMSSWPTGWGAAAATGAVPSVPTCCT